MKRKSNLFSLLVILSFAAALPAGLNAKEKTKNNNKNDSSVEDKDTVSDSASENDEQEKTEKEPGESSLELSDATKTPAEGTSLRHSSRMEFDARLVKGQAAKSGAVYLFKRVPRQLPGLVPLRRSYRQQIVEPVLRKRVLKPAIHSSKANTDLAAPLDAEKKVAKSVRKKEVKEINELKANKNTADAHSISKLNNGKNKSKHDKKRGKNK